MARERAQMAASRLNLLRGADPDAPIGPLEAAPPTPSSRRSPSWKWRWSTVTPRPAS